MNDKLNEKYPKRTFKSRRSKFERDKMDSKSLKEVEEYYYLHNC